MPRRSGRDNHNLRPRPEGRGSGNVAEKLLKQLRPQQHGRRQYLLRIAGQDPEAAEELRRGELSRVDKSTPLAMETKS